MLDSKTGDLIIDAGIKDVGTEFLYFSDELSENIIQRGSVQDTQTPSGQGSGGCYKEAFFQNRR